jgi:hypothetical protein
MSSKHTPNWTQRVEEVTPPNVVCTRKNTTFDDWKGLVNAEFLKQQFEADIRPINLQHGWEFDETPYSFVQKYISRARKIASRG